MSMLQRAGAILATFALLSLPAAVARAEPAVQPDPLFKPYADPQILARLPDGRRIHLTCMGKGSPTVILTAGLGDWSGSAWRKVQGAIAAATRACAWDRAGFGFSDPSPEPQDLPHTTADLEGGLKAAGIAGPYVIVGHSLGGYESLAFADRHRDEVAGMVLVDPSVPGQAAMFKATAPKLNAFSDSLYAQAQDALRDCIAKLKAGGAQADKCAEEPADYPADLKLALRPYDRDPARGATELSLYLNFDKATEQAVNPRRAYGDMPLIVLSAADFAPELLAMVPADARPELPAFASQLVRDRDALAALSTRGENRTIDGTSHYIQLIRPQVVIDAVREVVAKARAPRS